MKTSRRQQGRLASAGLISIPPGQAPAGVSSMVSSQPRSVAMSIVNRRGKPVDKRTDIWAFGCVLFEMLAGTRAFRGDTPSDTMQPCCNASRTGHGFLRRQPRASAACCGAASRRVRNIGCTMWPTRGSRSGMF